MEKIIQTILFLILLSGGVHSQNENPRLSQPNILFIMVDDLRPELGCYGKEVVNSPNIDRLARRGQLFKRAYVNYPVCGPSRAVLLSGLYASRNRFQGWNCSQDQDVPGIISLPMHFKNNGYSTVSLGKVYNNIDDGKGSWNEVWRPVKTTSLWDYQSEEGIRIYESLNVDRAMDPRSRDNRNLPKRGLAFERVNAPDDIYEDGKIATKAVEKLQEFKNDSKPFFMAVGFKKPHLPFNAPEKYWSHYDSMEIELPGNMYSPQDAPLESLHNYSELRAYYGIPDDGPFTASLAKELIKGYYACVSYVDAQIGRVLDGLENLGMDENTIIVLWGDHGWQLGEHDLWCKHSNFSTSLNIPFIVRIPGIDEGGVKDVLVSSVDVFPTLCDLIGLDKPFHLQGKSFASVLKSKNDSGQNYVYARSNLNGESIITQSHNYTEFYDKNGKIVSKMLYDLEQDPLENTNIAGIDANKNLIDGLSKLLAQHIENRDVIKLNAE